MIDDPFADNDMISVRLDAPYTNYELFADGRLYNHWNKNFLKCHPNSSGYMRYEVQNSPHKKKFFVHKLLATYFISNPCEKYFIEVDHIDNNKTNNDIANLRWLTRNMNQQNRKMNKNKKFKHKNIYINAVNHYEIKIKRNGNCYCKTLPTLDEAIKQRNLMLSQWPTY